MVRGQHFDFQSYFGPIDFRGLKWVLALEVAVVPGDATIQRVDDMFGFA
jgi:hypothetical protein